ncbi:HAD-IA family hydrolase [Lactobacillus sp. ESL0679]|uniref:HAD-IA family hydrolase n=1 Tax=Lactobacillus sp. ESL0679 TaxID=2983209 RepID=UPI0023F679C7|nr:HAD-IA family hydrolase [Lactobacillus sp. ESL0679]MDF7683002.1 HAD-IA family hydrolase [Lactobacillus sp. ESL0679]
MIKTILFDWDGTLLNSNDLINESNMYALNKYGDHTFTVDEVKPFNGRHLIDVYRELYPGLEDKILYAYNTYSDLRHDQSVRLFPDVKEVLQKLKNLGCHLGVVSMKRKYMVNHGLNLFNLASVFDVVIGGDECKRRKPDAEPILIAMQKINANPKETLMIGDNWQDIESANNAHTRSVFVTWSQKNYEQIRPYQPTYCIDRMSDLLQIVREKK